MTEETTSNNGLAEDISDEKECNCDICTLKDCPYHKPEWIDKKESEEIKE